MQRGAIISDCGTYRYSLQRQWDPTTPRALWVMLNPSTADALEDDATVRRCIGFSKRWKCGGLTIINLFAFRATNPAELKVAKDPVGPENDHYIRAAVRAYHAGVYQRVVVAWGTHGWYQGRGAIVTDRLRRLNVPTQCLGVTKNDQPKHPLRLPYATVCKPWGKPKPFPITADTGS